MKITFSIEAIESEVLMAHDCLTFSKFTMCMPSRKFVTSADVVMKASGLHIATIRDVANKYGVNIDSTRSYCIGEDLLDSLSDIHVSQMKSYFLATKQHLSELTCAEYMAFVEFCEAFGNTNNENVITWDDIDTDTIRDQFARKIHELTQSHDLLCLFWKLNHNADSVKSPSFGSNVGCLSFLKMKKEDSVLAKVLQSRWFCRKANIMKVCYKDDRDRVRCVTLSARFHIFSDDNEFHIAC